MRGQLTKRSHVVQHRANLKRLVDHLEKKPLDYLPERSVECLSRFFSGYDLLGPPIWRDLTSFQFWLEKRLAYPRDSGAVWWRYIQLNSQDRYDSFKLFCRLYWQYCKQEPVDVQPEMPEMSREADSFDFYKYLYAISKKPGLIFGSSDDVQSLAAHLAGYFAGKKHSGFGLTHDEKQFHRFGQWLSKRHKLAHQYPWYRLVEMWLGAGNSFQTFFVNYDAFLTNYGKRVGGLDDLFETVANRQGTIVRRRKKLPRTVIRVPGSPMWWRSPANQ